MIEVILLERIERLGHMGQVVKVRPGFARNFLLPQNKALRATKANLELFEKQRSELEARNAAERSKAEALAGKLDNLKLVIIRQASETGHLFGSVSARDVSEAAQAAGHKLERTQVQIDAPIKTLGLFQVKVKLHPEVIIKLTINIARTQEEALVQAQKGTVVTETVAEAEEVEPVEAAPAAKADAETASEGEDAPKAKKPRAKKAS